MVNQKHIYEEKLENSIINQDEKYEELFQATAVGQFDYKKTKELLKSGAISLNNEVVEKTHRKESVISNIVRWAPTQEESIKLLELICLSYEKGKQIIKDASYVQTSLIAVAVRNKKFKLADYLIDKIGMDIDQKDSQGRTPLFYLLQNKSIVDAHSPRLEYLLQHGAKIDVEDYQKNKLLDCVENEKIKEKLQQARYNLGNVIKFFSEEIGKLFTLFGQSTNSVQSNIMLTSSFSSNNLPLLSKYQPISQQEDNLKTNFNKKNNNNK